MYSNLTTDSTCFEKPNAKISNQLYLSQWQI